VTDVEVEVIGLLARACERLVGSVFGALDEAGFRGLSATSALAVRALAQAPSTAAALAQALAVTPQAASKIATDLERAGLAERGEDDRDARVRPLRLTARGADAAAAMSAAEHKAVALWLAAARPGDLEATTRALRSYLDATEEPRSAPARRMRFS
jgi:DNA-binding MarR family transcriptional regulator